MLAPIKLVSTRLQRARVHEQTSGRVDGHAPVAAAAAAAAAAARQHTHTHTTDLIRICRQAS